MKDTAEVEERSLTAFAEETGASCVIADAEYRNHDAVSQYIDGKILAIRLREECDRDGYVDRCQFTRD